MQFLSGKSFKLSEKQFPCDVLNSLFSKVERNAKQLIRIKCSQTAPVEPVLTKESGCKNKKQYDSMFVNILELYFIKNFITFI
jgi:hypothetical protein